MPTRPRDWFQEARRATRPADRRTYALWAALGPGVNEFDPSREPDLHEVVEWFRGLRRNRTHQLALPLTPGGDRTAPKAGTRASKPACHKVGAVVINARVRSGSPAYDDLLG